MKSLLIIPALMLGIVPANAEVLLPNLYASEYCSLRIMGVDVGGAQEAAVRASMVPGDPIRVMIDGVERDADVVQAYREVLKRCPEYVN
jgi:hypothetical protein